MKQEPAYTKKALDHLAHVAWLLYTDDPTPENLDHWWNKCERVLDDSQ